MDISSLPLETSATSDSTNHSSHTPTRRSKVWEYFEPELVEENGVLKAVCKYCGAKLTTGNKSGTNSHRNHIAEYCPKINAEDRKKFLDTVKKRSLEGPFTFDPRKSRELMTEWCISAEVPFNKFEDPKFEPWMESLQPTLVCRGRQTIRNDCVSMFERMKADLRTELQSIDSRICFTSDLWTSNQKLGYLCLTAHYIDPNFVLKKKIIAFKDVKYPHNGLAIQEAITTCLIDYGIKEKMFTITLDNAGNNKTACDLLQESGKADLLFGGQHLLVRCCAHILNILVQDGLDVVNSVVEKIRDLIRHINSSPSRIQAFNEIAERECFPTKAGLALDVPHRWNSTHKMIVEALEYKIVLKRYATAQQQPVPEDEEDWSKVKCVGDFLGAFEAATKSFSANRHPTSHLFLYNVLCIHDALRGQQWQANPIIRDLAKAMDKKFDKYWDGNYNMALVICTVLDPRKKLDYLDFFYDKVSQSWVDMERSKNLSRDWLNKYFKIYETDLWRDGTSAISQTGASRSLLGSPVLVLGTRRLDREFVEFISQRRGTTADKSELDAYLEEPLVRGEENFEILTWWKTNSNKYPVLSLMARDFLAIPLSTVSSESAFSLSGSIRTEK